MQRVSIAIYSDTRHVSEGLFDDRRNFVLKISTFSTYQEVFKSLRSDTKTALQLQALQLCKEKAAARSALSNKWDRILISLASSVYSSMPGLRDCTCFILSLFLRCFRLIGEIADLVTYFTPNAEGDDVNTKEISPDDWETFQEIIQVVYSIIYPQQFSPFDCPATPLHGICVPIGPHCKKL